MSEPTVVSRPAVLPRIAPNLVAMRWAICLLGLLFGSQLAQAGQGMYMDVQAYVPSAAMTIDSVQCMNPSPGPELARRQYVEGRDDWSCGGIPSTFTMSIWSAAKKVASYQVTLSAWGSTAVGLYSDPGFLSIATLYPHFGLQGNQDSMRISVTGQNMQTWMRKINPDLQINQLVLPGSHDSGSAGISRNSPATADASPIIADAIAVAPSLVAGWSRSQNVDVAGQLRRGIRYLDLRLCGGTDVDGIHTCHSMAGQKLTDVIAQVKEFATRNPSELVILDFNHWYAQGSSDENEMRRNTYDYVQEQFGRMLASRREFGPTSRLRDMLSAGRTVIVASDSAFRLGYDYLWSSENTTDLDNCGNSTDICSYWPESSQLVPQTQSLTTALNTLRWQKNPFLLVVQTQLTPDIGTVLMGLTGGASYDLQEFTGTYKYPMGAFLDTPHLFDGVSGLIFIEDFSNGIDLTHRALRMMGS